MMTMALIVGIWTTTCIQSQISNVNHGHVKETYTIEQSGSFEFKREWFHDPHCKDANTVDTESGTLEIGKKLQGLFITGDTYEADFSTQSGVDLGAIAVNRGHLKIARGVKNSTLRNTMVGLFEYFKVVP